MPPQSFPVVHVVSRVSQDSNVEVSDTDIKADISDSTDCMGHTCEPTHQDNVPALLLFKHQSGSITLENIENRSDHSFEVREFIEGNPLEGQSEETASTAR